MVTLKEKLKSWEACWEALDWLGDRTEAEALRDCERGDWLLWWLWREKDNDGYANIRALTKAKAECARLVQDLMKDPRSIAALDACDQYYEGLIGDDQLAAAAADVAADASYADAAAAYAADAADADDASYAAADASYAAADDAYAILKILKDCADICRKYLFVPS
jgi:hypothetical protein